MSYLNALATDGLSVGLRIYTAKMNRAAAMNAPTPARSCDQAEPTVGAMEPERLAKPAQAAPPKAETPEEMAAGRAEAKAILAADGSLGFLAAAESRSAGSEAAEATVAFGGEMAAAAPMYAAPTEAEEQDEDDEKEGENGDEGTGSGPDELTDEEEKQVQKMKRRDQEVRTHEQAHITAGAGLAGAASFEYETGPDGQRYAVAGEVPIHTRGSSDPDQALREAETVKRAALAPAEPSSQDKQVAAEASADINRLKAEKLEKDRQETEQSGALGVGETQRGDESQGAAGQAHGAAEKGGLSAQAPHGQAAQMAPNQAGSHSGIQTQKRLAVNGDSFGSHVLSAYSAVKFAGLAFSRPALASA